VPSHRSLSIDKAPEAEVEIIASARRGEARGLTLVYERHAATLLRTAQRLLGNREDAEDLVHDLFVGLPELLGKYEHRDRFEAWLRNVTIRLALGRLRRDRERATQLRDEWSPAATTSSDPWNALDLERAIAALGVAERVVFTLRQLDGYPHDEIAVLLGISPGAVRVRFGRALEHLRHLLEPSR
jgi:RNA polymerase sigma-70 factor (ECF subfamily)